MTTMNTICRNPEKPGRAFCRNPEKPGRTFCRNVITILVWLSSELVKDLVNVP
jgi:hypothetical protein